MRLAGSVALAGLLLVGTAGADPIATDRPGEADPPTVVAPGVVQLEGAVQVRRETGDDAEPDTDSYTAPQLSVRLGLFRDFELRVVADGLVYQDRGGASNRVQGSDLGLDLKYRFSDQEGLLPAFGVIVGLDFPTGSVGVTSDGVDPTVELLFQWGVAERHAVVANLDFSAPTQGVNDRRRVFEFEPQVSYDARLTPTIGGFVEYFATIRTGGVDDEHSVGGGFTWRLNEDLQLDLSASGGVNSAAPEWTTSLGFSWRLQAWNR